jgi:hypothetical protein
MSFARSYGSNRFTNAFSETWRQDQLLLTLYNESLRQAFPEAIPQPFEQFGDSYPMIRHSIYDILQKEDDSNAVRAECQPNFDLPSDAGLGPEAALATTLANLFIRIAEIRAPIAAHASEVGLQLRRFVSEGDHFPIENSEHPLSNDLPRLRNQLKIDKVDKLPSSEIEDDFVIVGSKLSMSTRINHPALGSRTVPRLSAGRPPAPLDDEPLGCSADERSEAAVWPIMNIEAAPVAIEGSPRRIRRHSEGIPRLMPQPPPQRTASAALEPTQPPKTRFWSPFLSWFDQGPPPKRVQSHPQ